jgi:hypothetical protein
MNVHVYDQHFNISEFKLSLAEWIRLKLEKKVYVFHARKQGWNGELPFYIVKCGKHGYFLDYLHGFPGHNEGFDCPFCLKELSADEGFSSQ